MKKAILKKRMIKKAADRSGGYTGLAKRLNRSYRALLMYRTQGTAPMDIVAAIESIASEGRDTNDLDQR